MPVTDTQGIQYDDTLQVARISVNFCILLLLITSMRVGIGESRCLLSISIANPDRNQKL
ncbi:MULTISPECIES: hypothetical protein [Nostocales]|uniref:Uncharacterized protein n=3 Tax=Nostocales TaxID=1161 RepID=A0A8S9SWQ0_9CYAN|nr:hypothetical protein [Tolypothrix bouteillei]KAF3884268.1 hypothetical protein DA73_0400001255 [Tolypothrix bouteillei VB521301]